MTLPKYRCFGQHILDVLAVHLRVPSPENRNCHPFFVTFFPPPTTSLSCGVLFWTTTSWNIQRKNTHGTTEDESARHSREEIRIMFRNIKFMILWRDNDSGDHDDDANDSAFTQTHTPKPLCQRTLFARYETRTARTKRTAAKLPYSNLRSYATTQGHFRHPGSLVKRAYTPLKHRIRPRFTTRLWCQASLVARSNASVESGS